MAKTPWQYIGSKSYCWKAHFFKICFFVKYFRQRLLSLVNMGLHAAIIRRSPLKHEGEQLYKPCIVGDPRMVTPPLWKILGTPLLEIKPIPQSQKVYLQWKWEVIDTALTAALRSIQVQLLPRMPHLNSGKMKQTPITSCSAERFPKQMLKQGPFKVARTYLYARWLCFWIAFFGRNDLTDFHDFWHPNNKQ